MAGTSPAMKAVEDLRGVSMGSRLMPMVMLAVAAVSFVAFALRLPEQKLQLLTVANVSEIPSNGRNLFVIARVRGQADVLHFRVFTNAGLEKAGSTTDAAMLARADASNRDAIEAALTTLKSTLSRRWIPNQPAPDLSPAERDEIIGQTFSVVAASGALRPEELAWFFTIAAVQGFASELARDFPAVLKAQVNTLWVLALYALLPGLVGLVYRRSFGTWFAAAFVLLYLVNRAFSVVGLELIASVRNTQPWTEAFVRVTEEIVVLLLIVFRIRRHSSAIDESRITRARWFAGGALVFAVAVLYFLFNSSERWHALELSLALIGLALATFTQTRSRSSAEHGKNIVICVDGTWNEPEQRDFNRVATTNVFKLFSACKGEISSEPGNASHSKLYSVGKQGDKQIAYYYRGVGNRLDNSALGELFGGAFGLGAQAIVERAYLDVVKAYRNGDRIFIFGFSRGAAIARLVANAIGRRGVPSSLWTLRVFGRHWLLWKSARALDVKVDVLGCWDTVGSFGLAKNILGIPFQSINLLKDLTVSLCVKRAYHMLALDETRDAFVPTLMEPDPTAPDRIVEVWFSGNHSNVGGGYATDNLSDVTLDFLLEHISSGYASKDGETPGDESWGLYLSAVQKGVSHAGHAPVLEIDPNPRGSLRHAAGAMYAHAPRHLPPHAVVHDHVFDRLSGSTPVYAPQSLFNLNQCLARTRSEIETGVEALVATRSLNETESVQIRTWSEQHLSVTKWSHRTPLNPHNDLHNGPMN